MKNSFQKIKNQNQKSEIIKLFSVSILNYSFIILNLKTGGFHGSGRTQTPIDGHLQGTTG
jgi:hypothetical protein